MPKKPKGGRRNYDWAALTHEYVTEPDMSLRKLAKKYGIGYDTVAKKSKAEGWFATRKKYQSKLISKSISQTCDKQAKALSKESNYLAKLQEHYEKMVSDSEQYRKHLVETKLIEDNSMLITTEEKLFTKYDTRAMKDSFQMLKMMEDLSRSLLDIQRLEAMQKHEIDAARLELEREKFEWEKQKAEYGRPDSTNAIRIDGFEEGWSE